MKQRLLALFERIDQFSRRDRMALAGGALAALVGLEMMVVQPMRAKRLIIAQSVQAESTAQTEAEKAARAERSARLAAMQKQISALEAKLASLGLKEAHRDALSTFLNQTALRHGLVLAGARGLPVEEVTVTRENATPAEVADASANPSPTLFRHRAELKLQGPVAGLTQAIGAMERDIAPLRIERIYLAPATGGALQATVVVTTISQERAWLVF